MKPIASEIVAAGLFPFQRKKTAFVTDSALNTYAQGFVIDKLSSAFNQILCLLIMDALPGTNIFSGNSVLSYKKRWLCTKHDVPVAYRNRHDFIWHPAYVDAYQDENELESQIAAYEKELLNLFNGVDSRKDLLIFCTESDSFVHKYFT